MPLKLITELTPAEHRLVARAVDGFMPATVFDIHAHLTHSRHFAAGKRPAFLPPDTALGLAAYRAALGRWLPGRAVDGLFFGFPSAGNDRTGENNFVAAEVTPLHEQTNSRALALVAPEDDPVAVREFVTAHRFAGLKPYRLYAPVVDTAQAQLEEFVPRWMWQLCHELEGVLMIHLVRSAGIADPGNLDALRRLCCEFPRCRVVLAHVARSFNYRNALDALGELAALDNVVVDTSAVTETAAMRAALDLLGPRRVLFGSDFMVSELRGKCFTMGDGFAWVYADALPSPAVTAFENFAPVGVESLLCLREACESTGCSAADVADIFRHNALRLLAPHLRPEAVPPAPRGPELWSAARGKISGGTGLLSKRAEMFDPATWPSYFSRCSGAHIWDTNGRRYLDFTGGVGAILLGHADPDVNAAVHRRVSLGSYCTLASPDEVALADLLLELHPWAQRVRYARGGGESLALAVRIARAATGRSGIAFCGYHGWSDWYLAANLGATTALDGHLLPGLEPHGVPRELAGTAVPFKYNDLAAFDRALAQLDGNLAAVVMEPFRAELPRDNFVETVAARCRAAGAVWVVDEVTAGWRFGFPGGCARLGLSPDLAVYAKAMSNGYACGAVVGRDGVMDAANKSFISSSYWTDGIGPAAALACVEKLRRTNATAWVQALGERLQRGLREAAAAHPALGLQVGGQAPAPSLAFALGQDASAAKTLCIRGMLARGFMVSGQLYLMAAHTEAHLDSVLDALNEVLGELAVWQAAGRLQAEAGGVPGNAGFARLA